MKNDQKGFIVQVVIAVIAVLIIGAGVIYYKNNTVRTTPVSPIPDVVNNVPTTTQMTSTTTLPITCKSETDGAPVITSLSSYSGPIGTLLKVNGCNLSGLEGDLKLSFERADGKKTLLTDTFGDYPKTSDKLIQVRIKEPCQKGEKIIGDYSGIESECQYVELTPGVYKVYTEPWGKKSNVADFTITASKPVTCTADAKQCLNGSYVGQGPLCDYICPAGTEKELGIIKNIYQKNGAYYLDIDYVQIVAGGPNGDKIINDNSKIRTFEITKDSPVMVTHTITADGKLGDWSKSPGSSISVDLLMKTFNIASDSLNPNYPINGSLMNLFYIRIDSSGKVIGLSELFRP